VVEKNWWGNKSRVSCLLTLHAIGWFLRSAGNVPRNVGRLSDSGFQHDAAVGNLLFWLLLRLLLLAMCVLATTGISLPSYSALLRGSSVLCLGPAFQRCRGGREIRVALAFASSSEGTKDEKTRCEGGGVSSFYFVASTRLGSL